MEKKVDRLAVNKFLIIASTLFGNRIHVSAWLVKEVYLAVYYSFRYSKMIWNSKNKIEDRNACNLKGN